MKKRRIVGGVSLLLLIATIVLGVFAFSITQVGTQVNLFVRIAFFTTLALTIPFGLSAFLIDETGEGKDEATPN